MALIKFPYGTGIMEYDIPEGRFHATLVSKIHHYKAECSPEELVKKALNNPVGTPTLNDLAKGKNKIVLIASDHTRPVPSKVIVPQMLAEIRKGNPDADITILIATGCHRATTKEVIIMLARSNYGHGSETFYRTFAEEKDPDRMLQAFLLTPKEMTRVDQWQSQIID